MQLIDRYVGTLLGVHAGDALGAPYEKWEPEAIAADFESRGGLVPFDYPDPWKKLDTCPAGRPTDDSELTAALAESLLWHRGIDLEDQYQRFKRALYGESFLWDGPSFGFGHTTQRMLRRDSYKESQEFVLASPDLYSIASNGSLMRSAPLALYYARSSRKALEEATRQSSTVTHVHATAIETCVVFVRILSSLLDGLSPDEAWFQARRMVALDEEVNDFLEERAMTEPPATNVWMRKGGLAGSALHTLHIAIWCLRTSDDFRSGIQKAISFGGDTDTAAAVTGAFLGAHFGTESIPTEWKDVLKGRNRMYVLALKLHDARA